METTKKSGILLYILLFTMLAAVAAAVTLGVLSLLKIADVSKNIDEFGDFIEYVKEKDKVGEDIAQEDDVTIGGSYMIKSTLPISNAYKSGDTSDLTEKEAETLRMASAILDEIITPEMTPYEKELAVYDWMCENLKYDEGGIVAIPVTREDCDNPYGVLKHHNAVCVGYATTFRLFMQMLDIECMVVHDTWLSHSWNLIKLDGNWYHTDVYIDVSSGNYSNFNMNDTMCSSNHDWNREFFPAANELEYCYVYRNSVELTDIFTIPEMMKAGIDLDRDSFFFKLSSPTNYDYAVIETMMSMISAYVIPGYYEYSDVMSMFESTDSSQFTYMDWSWVPVSSEESVLLNVFLTRSDDYDEPVTLTDEDYSKIDDAVIGAFGGFSSVYYGTVLLISEADDIYEESYMVIASEGLYYAVITPDAFSYSDGEVVSVSTDDAEVLILDGQTIVFPDIGAVDIEAEIRYADIRHEAVYG